VAERPWEFESPLSHKGKIPCDVKRAFSLKRSPWGLVKKLDLGVGCQGKGESSSILDEERAPMLERPGEALVTEERACVPLHPIKKSAFVVFEGRAELFPQSVMRAQQRGRILRPIPACSEQGTNCETEEEDHPGVNHETVLERLVKAARSVVEQASVVLREGHVDEAESGPPEVPEAAADLAASPAELDRPRPVTVVEREVAEVVERDRAVPGVADLFRELGQLLIDRTTALLVARAERSLAALAKSGRDPESVARGGRSRRAIGGAQIHEPEERLQDQTLTSRRRSNFIFTHPPDRTQTTLGAR
jgi:hypothetical protein